MSTIFLGSVNRNCTFQMFFIITTTLPLHVSANPSHLQAEYIYWLPPKELFFYNGSIVLVFGYQLCMYIYIYISFLFRRFFAAVSMYMVDMTAYYYCYMFQY
jgi:hypothetical protein